MSTITSEKGSIQQSDLHLAFEIEDLEQVCESLEYENSAFEAYLLRQLQGATGEKVSGLKSTTSPVSLPPKKLNIPTMSEEDIEAWVHYYLSETARPTPTESVSEDTDKMAIVVAAAMAKGGQADSGKMPPSLSHLNTTSTPGKCKVMLSELEATRIGHCAHEYETTTNLETIAIQNEELHEKRRDHQKTLCEFQRDTKSAFDKSKQKFCAEFLVRFFDEKKRASDGMVTKMRLKLSTMAHQKTKLAAKVKEKEELSDVLNVVDMEQLRYENDQFLGEIEKKNQELHALKGSCGKVVALSGRMKMKTKKLEEGIKKARVDIRHKEGLALRLDEEGIRINLHVCEVKEALAELNERLENFRAPPTSTYILQKKRLDELRIQARSWQRKLDIAKLKYKGLTNFWTKICAKQRLIDARMIERQVKSKRHTKKTKSSALFGEFK